MSKRTIGTVAFAAMLFWGSGCAWAEDTPSPTTSTYADSQPSPGIPYRREVQTLPEQSFSALLTTLLLLAGVSGALWYLRKYLVKLQVKSAPGALSGLTVVERAHVHARLSLYVARYRDKEILFAQSGNQLVALSEFPVSESPGSLQ